MAAGLERRRIDLDGHRQRRDRPNARDSRKPLTDLVGLVRGIQPGLDLRDTFVDLIQLPVQKCEHLYGLRGQALIVLDGREQVGDFLRALCGDDAELGGMAAHGIDQGGSLAHQCFAHFQDHAVGLSSDSLHGNEMHARTAGRFTDRLGEPATEPRVIGIDDRAWKRGHRYGTIVCDLERRRIIDILPDREPATVTAWLAEHPTIAVIARDRGAGYRQAAAEGRPDAVQVADRWHLMENASAAFLNAVRRSMPVIRKAVGVGAVDPVSLSAAERRQHSNWLLREAENATILTLSAQGVAIKEIMRRTDRSRGLVRQVVRGARTDMFRSRMSSLDPFLARLETA
jgi:transposase